MNKKSDRRISLAEKLLRKSNEKYGFDMDAEIKRARKEYEEKKAKKMADSYKKDVNKDTKSQGRGL